jgi:putative ABC transport system permease protein
MRFTFRALIFCYPSRFRDRYAREMLDVFEARREFTRERGYWAVTHFYWQTIADLAKGLPLEWAREIRRRAVRRTARIAVTRRRGELMSSFIQDAKLAFRTLIRQPGFAIVAIATLALGIGANTAIFTLVNKVLLEPLPFANADELVRVWSSNPTQGRERYFTSPLSYFEWVERTEAFSGIAAAWPREVTLTDDVNTPIRLRTMSVTANWFDVLGATPQAGRILRPDDAGIAWGSWVLVLSYGIWQDRFGSDPSVIGTAVRIDGQPAEIVGVLQPGMAYPENVDVFTNFLPPRTQQAMYMDVIARMRPGTSVERAQNDLDQVARGLAEEFPRALSGWGTDIEPLFEVVVGDVRPALLTLLVATGLVLAIACANVANLLLARTEKRHRELALRSALGAERRRLVRQLLTESIVLGGFGATAGLAVALLGLRTLTGIVPAGLPRFDGVHIDLAMLTVALGSALVTGFAFGLAPAWQLFRVDLQSELKEGGSRNSGSARGVHARDALVIAQMALAVIVSVGAGLLIKSFANLRGTDPGFNPTGVVTFELNLPPGSYPDMAVVGETYGEILDRLRAVPGVQQAGATSSLPLTEPLDYLLQLAVIGEAPPEEGAEPHAWYRQVSTGFFETTGIPLVRGRLFEDRDREDAPGVVIVNRSLARMLLGDADPIGRRLTGVAGGFGPLGRVLNRETEIVGVIDDVRYGSLREPATPSLYFPLPQAPFRRMTIAMRTNGNTAQLLAAVRREVATIDPNLPLGNVMTLEDTVERSIARDRFAMLLVGLFGIVALSLAAVGIYGVLSYSVAQRTQELGVRIALGASGSRVLRLVMKRTALLIGTGVGIGILGSVVATRAIASQLFGVTARDPLTFSVVVALLATVGFLASYIPAWRATRISPLTALRAE